MGMLVSVIGLLASFYLAFEWLIPMGNDWITLIAISLPVLVLGEAFASDAIAIKWNTLRNSGFLGRKRDRR